MQKISLPDFAAADDCAFKATLVCSGRGYGKLMSCRLQPGCNHVIHGHASGQALFFLAGAGKVSRESKTLVVGAKDIVCLNQREDCLISSNIGDTSLTFLWLLHDVTPR